MLGRFMWDVQSAPLLHNHYKSPTIYESKSLMLRIELHVVFRHIVGSDGEFVAKQGVNRV